MGIINDEAFISNEVATEFGFIEKLCATFGFIKCLNKDNQERRLFFHSSEVKCGFEEMKMGDYVTFKRGTGNGKPLAKEVVVKRKEGEREEGAIVCMAKKEQCGSISYKYNDECFFVAFTRESVIEPVKLKVKDEVTFERAYKDGISVATNVCKKYNRPVKMQGVVTCIKDKYGFIDRCDVVKEIYFNVLTSPEYVNIVPGMEVEFSVKHLRNGKEEAVNLRTLPKGTVQFVEVFNTVLYGTLLRCPDTKKSLPDEQLTGNISYACPSEATVIQIPFADKDKLYPYSLHPGDIVAFKMAVDRRDELHHACQVQLCLDQFPSRKETRHCGVVKMYDAPAGLIESDQVSRSGQDDVLVAFKNKEWLVPSQPLARFTAVSYTPVTTVKALNGHTKTSVTALRIMPLKKGERMLNLRLYPAGSVRGTIQTAVVDIDDMGIIICQLPSTGSSKRSIPFTSDDLVGDRLKSGHWPKVGDEVQFGCLERTTHQKYLPPAAFSIELITNPDHIINNNTNANTPKQTIVNKTGETRKFRSLTVPDEKICAPIIESPTAVDHNNNSLFGWIVILKEHFGFVETSDHRMLYKFSPGTIKKSNLENEIGLGSVVEFSVSESSLYKRMVDVFKKVLTTMPVSVEVTTAGGRVGIIEQAISITENTDRDSHYHGVIVDCETNHPYPYTMTSLAYYKTKLFVKDRVLFSVSQSDLNTTTQRATHIQRLRQCSRVTAIKDNVIYLERFNIDEDDHSSGLPTMFQIHCDKVVPGSLAVDDIVQLDLDVDYETREIFVANHKLIK